MSIVAIIGVYKVKTNAICPMTSADTVYNSSPDLNLWKIYFKST